MVKVESIAFPEEEKKLSLVTRFGSSLNFSQHQCNVPPSPGEEEGKDSGKTEQLAALRRRLRESEQTIEKLRDQVAVLTAEKDASDREMRRLRRESTEENEELRRQLEAAKARLCNNEGDVRFGFEVEEKERLEDLISELEQERIVLAGMFRSASKRCTMLENRLAARAQAAIIRALDGGKAAAVPDEASGCCSVDPDGGELDKNGEDPGEARASDPNAELWDAPDDETSREDDRWCRGDWGNANAGGEVRELTFDDMPLEQCRRLVTISDNRLRVEDWVIRHACRCPKLGAYRHEPELEGGDDSTSASSSATHGALLTISSSCGSRRRGAQDQRDPDESSDVKVAAGQASVRPQRASCVKIGLKDLNGYSTGHMQLRANPMTGGVTRAAWKTGSFATHQRLQPESQVQGIFTSFLGGSIHSPPKSSGVMASVVDFAT